MRSTISYFFIYQNNSIMSNSKRFLDAAFQDALERAKALDLQGIPLEPERQQVQNPVTTYEWKQRQAQAEEEVEPECHDEAANGG